MNLENYVYPDTPGNYSNNATMDQVDDLLLLLTRHGISCSRPWVELVAAKDATTQLGRTLPFEDAQRAGIKRSDSVYITFQIGTDQTNRTTAGYLLSLFERHGAQAMVKRLYLEHMQATEDDWNRRLLSLPAVQRTVAKEFKP